MSYSREVMLIGVAIGFGAYFITSLADMAAGGDVHWRFALGLMFGMILCVALISLARPPKSKSVSFEEAMDKLNNINNQQGDS